MSIVAKTTMTIAAMVIIGIIISIIIIKACNSNGKFKTDYDERQKLMLGKSYKCAMITAWVLMAVYIVIDMGGVVLPVENAVIVFTILLISLMVEVMYSVWTDAYWGRNNKLGSYIAMFIVVTLINLSSGVSSVMDGTMIVDGILTTKVIGFECALIFIVFGIEILVKKIVEKKANGAEEDDDEES